MKEFNAKLKTLTNEELVDMAQLAGMNKGSFTDEAKIEFGAKYEAIRYELINRGNNELPYWEQL